MLSLFSFAPRIRRGVQSGLLLQAGRAAFEAFAAGLRARGTDLVIRELFARLRAHFARLRTGFAAHRHHRAVAAADRHAQLAELGAVEARLHALDVRLVAARDEVRTVRVTREAFREALRAGGAAVVAAVLCVFDFGLVVGGDRFDVRTREDSHPRTQTGQHFSTIHLRLP